MDDKIEGYKRTQDLYIVAWTMPRPLEISRHRKNGKDDQVSGEKVIVEIYPEILELQVGVIKQLLQLLGTYINIAMINK